MVFVFIELLTTCLHKKNQFTVTINSSYNSCLFICYFFSSNQFLIGYSKKIMKIQNLFLMTTCDGQLIYVEKYIRKIIQSFETFQAFANKNVTNCLKMKKSLNFNSEVQLIKGSPLAGKKNASVDLILMYKNQEKTVTEEILVYDTPGMVSQIGGILSLFLGFSFFSLVCDLFELTQKIKSNHKM